MNSIEKDRGYKMDYSDAIRILKEERKLYESDYCTPGDGTPDGTLLAAIDEAIEGLEMRTAKKSCFNCGHSIYIGGGDYLCDVEFSKIVLEEYNEPTDDFLYCDGKDWEEE